MEEVPLKELGEAELEGGVNSRNEVKHTGRNDLLLIEKILRYDTRCYFNVRSKADMNPHVNNN